MDRNEIFQTVKFAVNRGDTLDQSILPSIRKAILWLERNYNMAYMHRWVTFTAEPNTYEPTMLPMPPRCKAFEFIRFLSRDGYYTNIRKVHPQELEEQPRRNTPRGFWLDGDQHIVLEAIPSEAIKGEIGYWQFTDFATVGPTDTHWLFDNAEDCVIARTMMYMVPIMRAPEIRPMWETELLEGIKTLMIAEENFKEGPTGAAKMLYGYSE